MTLLLAVATLASCPVVTLPKGHPVPLVTDIALSSKTHVKGAMVPLRTASDVKVDGVIVIPAATEVAGQISDARATGGLGVSGRLAVRPLYLRVGKSLVRLAGATGDEASVGVGGVIGLAFVPAVSGRSASIPAGSALTSTVAKDVALSVPCPSAAE